MIVCSHCLEAIESHEGNQWKRKLDWDDSRIDENDECFCEWCEEMWPSTECYEIWEDQP